MPTVKKMSAEIWCPDYEIVITIHYENTTIQIYWEYETFQINILIFVIFLLKT